MSPIKQVNLRGGDMLRKIILSTLGAISIFHMTIISSALAVGDSVAEVPSSFAASAVVRIRGGCSGVLVSPSWVLTIAHCVDRWSDRSDPDDLDVYVYDLSNVYFTDPDLPYSLTIDRAVRVDGASTLTNSLGLVHLSHPAPPWTEPIQLYRGDFPDSDQRMEIWGYGGGLGRTMGGVKIADKRWRDINQFWSLCLQADPSRIVPGDSGGPVLISHNGRKEVIGINWNTGSCAAPGGGRAAAAFDINDAGLSNNVSHLIDRIIHEPMGHGAGSLDIENDGMNEIVFYDSHSGELRLMGIGDFTRFHVRLIEQLPTGFQFLEVGDFNGDGLQNEILLYRGDTGELRSYHFEMQPDGNYFLVPWKRYTTFTNLLLPEGKFPSSATATTSGDYDEDGETELAIIDRENDKIHIVKISTGEFLGSSTHELFGQAQIFTSGRFRNSQTRDWIAVCKSWDTTSYSEIDFFKTRTNARGKIRLVLREEATIGVLGRVSQMVRGEYDGDNADDLLLYRSEPTPIRWLASIYTNVGAEGTAELLLNRTQTTEFNMIIPGNFDSDGYDEIAMWRRAYDRNRQAMYIYNVDAEDSLTRLSGRVWNWVNRWWTHMQ